MADQWIAVLVGGGVMIALRVVDFFLPKGWISNWTKRHGEKSDDGDKDDDEQTADA